MSQTPQGRPQARRSTKDSYQPTGVFQVRNLRTGKLLLGSSPNLPAMFNRMTMQLDSGRYRMHPELQRDWNAEGAESFVFEILEELAPPKTPGWDSREDQAILLELWLEKVRPYGEAGYNRMPGMKPPDAADAATTTCGTPTE